MARENSKQSVIHHETLSHGQSPMSRLDQAAELAGLDANETDFEMLVGALAQLREWASKEPHLSELGRRSMCANWREIGRATIENQQRMNHITDQSVLMHLMHVAGKDAADKWLVSNPQGTEAELITWLVERKPTHLRADLAREKADHIAWRFIGCKELHRHARASFPTPSEADAWMDKPNKIFNGEKPSTFAGMRHSGTMVREVIDSMNCQR